MINIEEEGELPQQKAFRILTEKNITYTIAGKNIIWKNPQGKKIDIVEYCSLLGIEVPSIDIDEIKEEQAKKRYNGISAAFDKVKDLMPFKFGIEGTESMVLHKIIDSELKIIKPIITNLNGIDLVFEGDRVLSDFLIKFSLAIKDQGITLTDRSALIRELIIRTKNDVFNYPDFSISDFRTFSMDRDVWKCSYIDPTCIDNAPNDTPTWDEFGMALSTDDNREEAYSLLKSWIWTLFDKRAIRNNRQLLWLYGEGFDGKSAVVKVLRYIISGKFEDTSGSSSIGIDQLKKPFWGQSFYGTNYVIVNEIPGSDFLTNSNDGCGNKIHQVTGHDAISIEAKGKKDFDIVSYARIALVSNYAPAFDSGKFNAITRVIPIEVTKSYFKGLEHRVSKEEAKQVEFEQNLFNESFAFLKKCKQEFESRFDYRSNLISISKQYQDDYFQKSERSENNYDISKLIFKDIANDYYRPSDITILIKFAFAHYQNQNMVSINSISEVRKAASINTKIKKFVNKVRTNVYKASIDKVFLDLYNNNEKKIRTISPVFIDPPIVLEKFQKDCKEQKTIDAEFFDRIRRGE